jgi:hypothetical protein
MPEYAAILITLFAAVVGILQDSWDKKKRRFLPLGTFRSLLLLAAVAGSAFSIWQTTRDRAAIAVQSAEREQLALQANSDLHRALRHVTFPFYCLYQHARFTAFLERRLWGADSLTLDNLFKVTIVTNAAQLDSVLKDPTFHRISYEFNARDTVYLGFVEDPWWKIFSQSFKKADVLFDRIVVTYGEVLSPDVVSRIRGIQEQGMFVRYLNVEEQLKEHPSGWRVTPGGWIEGKHLLEATHKLRTVLVPDRTENAIVWNMTIESLADELTEADLVPGP